MRERVEWYEKELLNGERQIWYTLDENLILIAQYLKRKGQLKYLSFISSCNCGPRYEARRISIDDEGDMVDDPHHGFFNQRLRYLR